MYFKHTRNPDKQSFFCRRTFKHKSGKRKHPHQRGPGDRYIAFAILKCMDDFAGKDPHRSKRRATLHRENQHLVIKKVAQFLRQPTLSQREDLLLSDSEKHGGVQVSPRPHEWRRGDTLRSAKLTSDTEWKFSRLTMRKLPQKLVSNLKLKSPTENGQYMSTESRLDEVGDSDTQRQDQSSRDGHSSLKVFKVQV